MNVEKRQKLLSYLSAFRVILEDYPKLIAGDYYGGKDTSLTTISFMLEILGVFGVSHEFLCDWLSKLLGDEEDSGVKKGLLIALEESIKAILLAYLTGLYTCPVDPVLPDYFLKTPYTDQGNDLDYPIGVGIKVPISQIDAFGLLQNCPTSEKGSVFYFDTVESEYTPRTVYKSTDMNAFLWYVINKGNGDDRSIWDNRVWYRFLFKKEETGQSDKDLFVNTKCINSPSRVVRGVGVKNEIVCFDFREAGMPVATSLSINDLKEGNFLTVWGVADRYYHEGLRLANTNIQSGRLNKTVFQFNSDYIYSLKLFDSKTIVAQIINAILGISSAFSGKFSLQMNIIARKIEKLVEKVISQEGSDNQDEQDDSYFIFSDKEYSDIEKDATLRYNGKYETGNETGDLADVDIQAITQRINEINLATNPEDKEEAIKRAIMGIAEDTSRIPEIDTSVEFSFSKNFVLSFIKETMIQVAIQILSPKVMLLFAINARFLGDTQEQMTDSMHWENFFKDFWNILRSCIRKISDLVIQALLDLVIGQLKPILVLLAKKLLLETVYYYKILLEEMILACTPSFNFGGSNENLVIDNVNYADIIPLETTPKT
jgi:hypothetical protein